MAKQEWLVGVVGLLLGIVATVAFGGIYYSSNHNGAGMGEMMKMMGGNIQQGTCSAESCDR